MKIEMLETTMQSLDGETVQKLIKGHVYDTVDSPRGERLAQHHIDLGVAVAAKDEPVPIADPEEKAPAAKGRK